MARTEQQRREGSPLVVSVVSVVLELVTLGCDHRDARRAAPSTATSASSPPRPSAAPASRASVSPAASAREHDPAEPTVTLELRSDGGLRGLVATELSDVGPAGPAAATAEGVVLVTKRDRVVLARPAKGPVSAGRLSTVSELAADFSALGRAPAVAGGSAYWVSGGRLLTRRADGTRELEVLADDARDTTRVAAVAVAPSAGGVAVAYVGRPDSEGTSHVWLRLGQSQRLDVTPDGAGASSVALVALGERLLVVSIDGRSAMTPLHARTVDLARGKPELGPDVVAWVAGPAHAWTEVFAGSDGVKAWAFLPIERDAVHFGLATVSLGAEPRMDAPVTFLDYPNGIDIAPVATAVLCEKAYVVMARPAAAAPHSPQELVIAPSAGGETAVLADGGGFASVSLAAGPGGGLVAYVADGRTWARGLRCH